MPEELEFTQATEVASRLERVIRRKDLADARIATGTRPRWRPSTSCAGCSPRSVAVLGDRPVDELKAREIVQQHVVDASVAMLDLGDLSIALPIAASVFEPFGLVLAPEVAATSMAGSSIIVAVNAVSPQRLRLPRANG